MDRALEFASRVAADGAVGLLHTVLQLAAVIVPLMVAVEFLRAWRVLERLADWFRPCGRVLGVSGRASFPLMAGLVLGLAYGGGLILHSAREGNLSRRDAHLVTVFLATCHAIFEDTLLFVPLGVNPALLLGMRLGAAVVLTVLLGRLLWRAPGQAAGWPGAPGSLTGSEISGKGKHVE